MKLCNKIITLLLSLTLIACSEHVVYKQSNGSDQNSILVLSSNNANPVTVVSLADPVTPCGPTSDGRIVFTQQTSSHGGELYVVDLAGNGLTKLLNGTDDTTCSFVTPDNTVIYQDTVPAWNGRHNLMALPIGSAIPQNVAVDPQDQMFLSYAPDKSIIYLRKTSLPVYGFEILSTKIGAKPIMLAQLFPPNYYQPKFNVVTQDNKVIFSSNDQYQQGKITQNIYSVNTDGSNPYALAKNPPSQEIYCALTSDNRILYTEQTPGVIDGQDVTFGKLFIVNTDGSKRTLLISGSSYFNDRCVGVTPDNHVVFIRTPLTSRNEGIGELYSVFADGNSVPILLSAITSQHNSSITNVFEKTTPANRILFKQTTATETSNGTVYFTQLNSILANGTGLITLATNYNMVQNVTASDHVIYDTQVPGNGSQVTMNLYIVPSDGSVPAKPISSTTDTQIFGFAFYH